MRRLRGLWRYYRQALGRSETGLALIAQGLFRLTSGRCRLVRYFVVAQPVPANGLAQLRLGKSLAVRRLSDGDPALNMLPREQPVYRQRFEQGAICYGAFRGEELIGFIWFVLGPYEEDEVLCRFEPCPPGKVAWDFDVYVRPEYRLSRAFVALWDAALKHMADDGVEWTASRISAFNPMSVLAHRRLGARVLGRITFFRCGPLQVMLSSLPPFFWTSWGDRHRPEIPVRVGRTQP